MHSLKDRLLGAKALLVAVLAALALAVGVAVPALAADGGSADGDAGGSTTDQPVDDVDWYKDLLVIYMENCVDAFGVSNEGGVFDDDAYAAYLAVLENAREVLGDENATVEEVESAGNALMAAVDPLSQHIGQESAADLLSDLMSDVKAAIPCLDNDVNVPGFVPEVWSALKGAWDRAVALQPTLDTAPGDDLIDAYLELWTAYNDAMDPETITPSAQLYATAYATQTNVLIYADLDIYTADSIQAVETAVGDAMGLFSAPDSPAQVETTDPDAPQFVAALDALNQALADLTYSDWYAQTILIRGAINVFYNAVNAIVPNYPDADQASMNDFVDAVRNAFQNASDNTIDQQLLVEDAHQMIEELFDVTFPHAEDPLYGSLCFAVDIANAMGDYNYFTPDAAQWEEFTIMRKAASDVREQADPESLDVAYAVGNLYNGLRYLFGSYANDPVYRLYNPYDGGHLFTASMDEVVTLGLAGWELEDVAWWAPTDPALGVGVTRLYNPYTFDHYYVLEDEDGLAEIEYLKGEGWEDEGTKFLSPITSAVPVFQLYNPHLTANTHLWTADPNEYEVLQGYGWQGEDVALYGAVFD